MRYYIIKKDDTLDKILNNFGLTYQNFISMNSGNLTDIIKVGNKIKIGELRQSLNYKTNINKIYQETNIDNNIETEYICPYCKNIIIINKQ